MSLPALEPSGLLPVVPAHRHRATFAEIESSFVVGASSHQALRQEIWDAFQLWCRRAVRHFGHGEVWLAGTFVTDLPNEPSLRTVHFPATPSMAGNAIRKGDVGLGLLTIEQMFYLGPGDGGSLSRVRALGGTMDSHLGSSTEQPGWDAMWTLLQIPRSPRILRAGYVSVRI